MNKKLITALIISTLLTITGCTNTTEINDQQSPTQQPYELKSDSDGKTYGAKTPNEYSFSILDSQGSIVKNFSITHTKLMHLIVVRKDLAYFQHIHPEFNENTGQFSLSDLTFPEDGNYRLFADFAVEASPITIFEDITVGKNYQPQPLGFEETTKNFKEYEVKLAMHGTPVSGVENMLMFNITQNSKPVTDLEQYLGALGHSVILKEATLDFIHAHPMEADVQNGTVSFMVTFPSAGKYKIFTQFQKEEKVFTTDFVISVKEGMNMSEVDHSTMSH